jgi:hypothetical protein
MAAHGTRDLARSRPRIVKREKAEGANLARPMAGRAVLPEDAGYVLVECDRGRLREQYRDTGRAPLNWRPAQSRATEEEACGADNERGCTAWHFLIIVLLCCGFVWTQLAFETMTSCRQ